MERGATSSLLAAGKALPPPAPSAGSASCLLLREAGDCRVCGPRPARPCEGYHPISPERPRALPSVNCLPPSLTAPCPGMSSSWWLGLDVRTWAFCRAQAAISSLFSNLGHTYSSKTLIKFFIKNCQKIHQNREKNGIIIQTSSPRNDILVRSH